MNTSDELGQIVRLQVQKVPIKVKGEGYLPEEILPVDVATVDAWGMLGLHEGTWVVDAHHRSHPSGRGGGRRPLSIGFTGHYEMMQSRFGTAPVGIAGENLIIDGPPLTLNELGEGLVIRTASGDEIPLVRPRVAAPCLEFTSFMLGLERLAPLDEIEGPLSDLHDGRRGFIVAADHTPKPVTVAIGDKVFLAG